MKKNRIRAATIAGLIAAGALIVPTVANAHSDPWRTHWHYSNGQPTYKMCSWWDKLWGCRSGYR